MWSLCKASVDKRVVGVRYNSTMNTKMKRCKSFKSLEGGQNLSLDRYGQKMQKMQRTQKLTPWSYLIYIFKKDGSQGYQIWYSGLSCDGYHMMIIMLSYHHIITNQKRPNTCYIVMGAGWLSFANIFFPPKIKKKLYWCSIIFPCGIKLSAIP